MSQISDPIIWTDDGSTLVPSSPGRNMQMGSATIDAGTFTMIKGAQTGDPQVQFALSADDQGDFSITTDTGNITLDPTNNSVIIPSTTDAGSILELRNNDTIAADHTIGDIQFLDGSDNLWGGFNVYALDATGSAEYSGMSINGLVNGEEVNYLGIESELDGSDKVVTYSLLEKDYADTVYFQIGQASTNDNAATDLVIRGQAGGADDDGDGGLNGNGLYIESGAGSDATGGGANGGNSGDVYIGAGEVGDGDGGGSAGTMGAVILGENKNGDISAVKQGGLTRAASSEAVADDGTITLATGVAGILTVWTEAEYMQVYVDTAGVISSIVGSANTATTDSDTNLCVYDGGTGAVIKNRLGSEKTVRYLYNYS